MLLAGLGKVTAETGQFIRAGEPVGAMARKSAPGTLTGDRLQDSRPVLYIEFRKNGEAIDPRHGGLVRKRGSWMMYRMKMRTIGLLFVARSPESASTGTGCCKCGVQCDTYKQLNLFGDVFAGSAATTWKSR